MLKDHRGAKGAFSLADLVFLAVVMAAYVSAALQWDYPLDWSRLILSLTLGIVFALIGALGFPQLERLGRPGLLAGYFLFQLALGTYIIYLNRVAGVFWILLLPLASQAIMTLPRHFAIVYCLAIAAAFTLVIAVLVGWREALQNGLSYLAGILFVAVFTQIALNEQRARAEVERLAQELSEANRKLSEYAVHAEELATAKERNRLAREIHDSLGHHLTAINMQLEAARALVKAGDASQAGATLSAIEKAQALAKDGLHEVRRSVAALRISPLEGRALAEAVEALLDGCRAAGMGAEWRLSGVARPLPAAVELTLYRAAQEGLTNVRKHAQASQVNVQLDYTAADCVRLTIEDDGVGCAVAGAGFGLLGLRERVRLLNGRVETRSAVGQGFTLAVEVPA